MTRILMNPLYGLMSLILLTSLAYATEDVSITSATFGGLDARNIGPAVMGGRIADVVAQPGDSLTIYVGTASGGIWKSTDSGTTFRPIFDDHTQSIGALALDPKKPETIWVGTGETWVRNSVSVGTGIYKSDDGGENWQLMGLEDSERIARVVVHPQKSQTVYVCATGHLWDGNEERGVYKTTDSGKTWRQILYVDENTGCSDLSLDPQDPSILYAGMWQFRRLPWTFESGGPGSGLHKSSDGGSTWERLSEGLPDGNLGRIAVAVAPSRPNVIYAIIESKDKTALYRSDDLGAHWKEMNTSFNVSARPFYFARLVVDPTDFNRVYKPGLTLSVSRDGGNSFTSPFTGGFGSGVHSDHHALWINPENPRVMLLGTDGGLYSSPDRGAHWRQLNNMPLAQFYQVSADMNWPYNVYGGLQDNGSWVGPSRGTGGIRNRDWKVVGFGDGFYTIADPNDPDIVYSEYQGGNVMRVRVSTGEVKDIKPYPKGNDPKFRANWNAPIHLSPTQKDTLYIGTQYLFKSSDRGESWTRISPDLTTNDAEKQQQMESGGLTIDNSTAENHTTIYTISESSKDPNIIWVGTDDGNLQVTKDAGSNWTNVVANVPNLPPNTWVTRVEASHHSESTAYVTFDGHRTGDMTTYVYRTTDLGNTWTSLFTEDVEGYALVIREDLKQDQLLFLGTEFGLYISINGGSSWARFTGNLPKVAVRDLVIHPRDDDLVIATHGRSVYILDDITPLRHLTTDVLQSDVALLPSRPATMVIQNGVAGFSFSGSDEFIAPNPPEAAFIHYYLKKRHIFGDLKIEVYGSDGELITTLPGGKRVGINRVLWPMRLKPPKMPPGNTLTPAFTGPRVAEGSYTFKLIKGKQTLEGQVELVADPRSTHSAEDRALQQQTAMKLYRLLEDLTYTADTLMDLTNQAEERNEILSERDGLRRRLEGYAKELEDLRKVLVATHPAGWLSGEEQLREKLSNLFGAINGYEGKPTHSQLEQIDVLATELEAKKTTFETLTGNRLAELNTRLEKKKMEPLSKLSREEWLKKQES